MAAELSVAANAFAVVGLADVVFRQGKDLVDLLVKVKRADDDVKELQNELQALESRIVEVRLFAAEFQASPFVIEDQRVLPYLDLILRGCEHEFNLLHGIVSAAMKPADGWLRQLGRRVGWALKDQKVVQSRQQLEKYKSELTAALSIIGRYVNT